MTKAIKSNVPKRGDVVHYMDFDKGQKGSEIQKIRPALVITPLEYNQRSSLIFCCPITSTLNQRNHPLQIPMPVGSLTRGTILVNQLRTFDQKARSFDIVEELPDEIMEVVLARLLPLVS